MKLNKEDYQFFTVLAIFAVLSGIVVYRGQQKAKNRLIQQNKQQ